jgi:hypothetical protein
MGQCPLVQLYFDPDAGQWGEPSPDNPWFNTSSPNPVYNWGYDFNHERPQTREFVTRVTRYWINEYHMDGFRFDFTKGFTNTPGDGWNYDPERINILEGYADSIREVKENAILILEHFTENTEEQVLANYGFLLWGNLNCQYGQASMGYPSGPCGDWDFSRISWKNRNWSRPNLVGYMESHDEERNMYKNITYGNASGDYSIKDLSTALQRIEMNSAFFFTVPGPKMIWQFGELGYDYSIEYNGRTGNKPIRWDYYNDMRRRRLYEVMSALIHLKKEESAFHSTDFNLQVDKAVKTITIRDSTMNVLVIGNFDVEEQTPFATFPVTGRWYEFFSGDSLTLQDLQVEMTLSPGEYLLYTTKKLTRPQLPSAERTPRSDPAGLNVWPNPLGSGTLHISFSSETSGEIHLQLQNMQGEVILNRQYQSMRGINEILLDPGESAINRIPPGIYLLTLRSAHSRSTRKIVIY